MAKEKSLTNWVAGLFGKEITDIHKEQNTEGLSHYTAALSALGQYMDVLDEQEKKSLIKKLPAGRLAQYVAFDEMEEDPICGGALNIHVSNALTYDEDAGYSVKIESKTNENDPIVKDLRNTFHEWQQENSKLIVSNVAKYGLFGVRPYVYPKKGIDLNRTICGMEGHPGSFQTFESLGQTIGHRSKYQDLSKGEKLLMPWQFIVFKSPGRQMKTGSISKRINPLDPSYQFDICDDEPPFTYNETLDYGKSLFYSAYTPYKMVGEACLALLVARLKSAQRETNIGLPIGNQDPIEAAKTVNELTRTLQRRDDEDGKRSLKEDLVRISRKHIIPYDASGKGQLVFSQTEPNINIDGIQDLMTWIKMQCGSLYISPEMVGFADMMNGGIGEGGWLRSSLMAATYGTTLRQSLRNGFERMYELHVKAKFGKIYSPDKKPWKTRFHAVTDAKEREANERRLGNMNFAERFQNLILTLEDEGKKFDRNMLINVICTDFLKLEEPMVAEILNIKKPAEEAKKEAGNFKNLNDKEKAISIEESLNMLIEPTGLLA